MLGRLNINRKSDGNSGVAPMNVKSIKIKAGNQKVTLNWNDPEDTYDDDGTLLCTWKGTKVVYKAGSYPTNVSDGILALDNQERNKYSTSGFEINGLTNGETYYFAFYPYSDKNVYNKNEVNRISGTPTATKIYGVKKLLSSSATTWERTDDAYGLVANAIKSQSNLSSGVRNDFDNLSPWADIKTVNFDASKNQIVATLGDATFDWTGAKGQVMTVYPEMWVKRWQDSQYEYIQIADGEIDGFTHIKEWMAGRFTMSGSSSGVFSRSGQKPLVNTNITNFRNYAKKLGDGWGQLDWHWFILQMLYLVEYADSNSQKILGQGNVSSSSTLTSGGCNSLGMKSGCLSDNGSSACIYRGWENPHGDVYNFVDGINIKDYIAYICTDPTKYAVDTFSGDYKKLGYTNASSSGYVSKLGYDANYPLFGLPVQASGSSSTYYCDYAYFSSGNRIAYVGGFYYVYDYAGLWCWNLINGSSTTSGYLGARLLKTS